MLPNAEAQQRQDNNHMECTSRTPDDKVPSSDQPLPPNLFQAEKKRRKKGSKKKNLEALLFFQEHLVREKGLPPSRLMLEHAASKTSISPDQTNLEDEANNFKLMIGKHKEQHKNDIILDSKRTSVLCSKFQANTFNSSNVSQDLESGEEPPTRFTYPSCLKSFTTEHSLSIHIYLIVAPGTY